MTNKNTLRSLIASENWKEALDQLKREIDENQERPEKLWALARFAKKIPDEAYFSNGYLSKKVAVLSGYTSDFLAEFLRLALLRRGILAEIWKSEYGQFEQSIYSQDEALLAFKPDIAFFYVGRDHLGPIAKEVDEEKSRWLRLIQATQDFLKCEIVFPTFEAPTYPAIGQLDLKMPLSESAFVHSLNRSLALGFDSRVHIMDAHSLANRVGIYKWRNEAFFDSSKVPVAYDHLWSYAWNLAAVTAAVFGKSKKCLVLDLDNTLWGGVVGDDGLGGIKIGEDSGEGEAFKRFQYYIKTLKDRGVILAVCSKNEEANAKEPFERRTDMVLRLEDISCFVANWEPKHLNIQRIAQELNIGTDSIVFADDNPAEREIVRQNLPEVEIIELAEDPAEYAWTLFKSGWFETISVTEEDLKKTEQYRSNAARTRASSDFKDYDEFLKTLDMRAVVSSFDSNNLPRISQLINKTNQFNLTTKRYSLTEVQEMMDSEKYFTSYVKLMDKFGDHGLIGILIAEFVSPQDLAVDTWLMSCRVLKRGVEALMMRQLLQHAQKAGVQRVLGNYLPTPKNKMVEKHFDSFNFSLASESDGAKGYKLEIESAANLADNLSKKIFIQQVSEADYSAKP